VRSTTAIKESLRELSIQLSLLNHQIGGRLRVKDADFDCLDLINRHGPMSPSALARRAGQHPATMTGVLDRLERAAGSPASVTPRTAGPSRSARSRSATRRSSSCTPE
jgi:hypothetical protein